MKLEPLVQELVDAIPPTRESIDSAPAELKGCEETRRMTIGVSVGEMRES